MSIGSRSAGEAVLRKSARSKRRSLVSGESEPFEWGSAINTLPEGQNAPYKGGRISSVSRKVAEGRSATMARLILFVCSRSEDDVRREPASGNGSIQIWCSCGSHTFPKGNLLPETPREWIFVVERVSLGIHDAQMECEARIRRLIVSDHVRRHRDKLANEGHSLKP